jgi:ribosome-binding protein aMBF1 (putative translation factor)
MKSTYIKSDCGLCGQPFLCHPGKVTTISTRWETLYVCRACVDMANRHRTDHHLPLIKITPGAYDPEPS